MSLLSDILEKKGEIVKGRKPERMSANLVFLDHTHSPVFLSSNHWARHMKHNDGLYPCSGGADGVNDKAALSHHALSITIPMTIPGQSCRERDQPILKPGNEWVVRTHVLDEQEATSGSEHAQPFAHRLSWIED
jgi:hypothetical protein